MKTILVIEDDKFMRDLLINKIKKEGFRADGAASAEEALEEMEKNAPNLILLDLILPRMDGFEFIQHMKKNPQFANIPILILSNLGDKKDIEKAEQFGVKEFLIKANFTPSEIVQKIHDLLNKKYL
ncbi:MAG: response regulator [Candidatus Niyogibacteria bacterium]|nr:response regulator [Candidatus Niyogibacteria bacterium]